MKNKNGKIVLQPNLDTEFDSLKSKIKSDYKELSELLEKVRII